MAFTVTFPTTGTSPAAEQLGGWMTDQGEPSDLEAPGCVTLRALPVRVLLPAAEGPVKAHIEVTARAPLTRLVNLLFELSNFLGADVRLAGVGEVSRAELWLRLADEQDRVRIAEAVERSAEHDHQAELLQRLWRIVSAIRANRDDRWHTASQRIVEMREVGEGISLEDAAWHTEDPQPGDLVPVPVDALLHTLAWRWLSEAYPGIAEDPHITSSR